MTGVPATTAMHFRNGAVAISYVSTLLLRLVDDGKVSLDDKLSKWLPDVPNSDRVTLGQLAQMTSGYVDYVIGNTEFDDGALRGSIPPVGTRPTARLRDVAPAAVRPRHQLELRPHQLRPAGQGAGEGDGRGHAHPVVQDEGAWATRADQYRQLLHPRDSRRPCSTPSPANAAQALQIPTGTPFYEESTYWNPSWTITHGAIQTTNIYDMEASAVAIGSGKLLSKESYERMVSTDLRGKTHAQPGCTTCAEMTDVYTYGMGIVISGDWLLQNPLFAGEAGVMAYLPSKKIAIAIAVTYEPEAFDDQGDYVNAADVLFRRIGAKLAPEDAPPIPPK